ncbi:MAG: radical SAM protein [Oscillospiraceae bacterium]|jgi:histone acetyltransferase (RNA polymerase elongator complex component)|nr:radical SAM protein [Oscillospiraceae bacterium]
MDGVLKHANVSVFVPHEGCPHQCIFCDQRIISGEEQRATYRETQLAIRTAINSLGEQSKNAEIAFFGGSFTAIYREDMMELLKAAYPFVANGRFKGIRCSTRPDAINEEILLILKNYGVTSIELGAQSMDDEVLRRNRRGHTAQDVVNASKLIKSHGFSLGLQMMTGLYCDTKEKSIQTARAIAELMPDTVRIYPTIVLEQTVLHLLMLEGKYVPQTLPEAVELCSELLGIFREKGINVIKLGLHASELLESKMAGGPYHPAFRELCEGRMYLDIVTKLLADKPEGRYTVSVGPTEISKAVGQRKCNITSLWKKGYQIKVKGDEQIKVPYEVKIEAR